MIDFESIVTEETPQAKRIASYFREYHKNVRTVVDIGCGPGTYVSAFRECGFDAFGIDVDERIRGKDYIIHADIFDYHFDHKVDLAVSLEVAEHLQPETSLMFVDKLIEASDMILFSAAYPGQNGDGHINCRFLKEWMEIFASKGYCVDDVATYHMKEHIVFDKKVTGWFTRNAVILVNKAVKKRTWIAPPIPKNMYVFWLDQTVKERTDW